MHYQTADFVYHRASGSIGIVMEVTDSGCCSVSWLRNAKQDTVAWWTPGDLEIVDNLSYLLARAFNYHGTNTEHLKTFENRFRNG